MGFGHAVYRTRDPRSEMLKRTAVGFDDPLVDLAVAVEDTFERTLAELEREPGETLGLRRLLDSTVDDASVSERSGGAWVDLRKGFPPAEPRA